MRPRAWIAAWCSVVVLGLAPRLLLPAPTDVAWPLYLADLVLGGARHGVDFLEVNPPLFIWLAIPPVAIHHLMGITAWHANVVWVGVLAAASLLLSATLLRSTDGRGESGRWFLLGAGFCFFILPRWEFGQREHLAILGVVPYYVLAAARLGAAVVDRRIAIAAGIAAGLGFSLKPFFLVPWLVLEWLIRRRVGHGSVRRVELLAVVTTGAGYALAVIALSPDYLSMAMRLGPFYAKLIGNPMWVTLGMAGPVLFVAAYIAAQRIERWPTDGLRSVCIAGYFGFLACAVLQRKGFSYHYLPAWGFGFLLLLRSFQVRPSGRRMRPSGLVVIAGFALAFVVPAYGVLSTVTELRSDPSRPEYNESYGLLLPEVRKYSTGGPMLVLFSNPAAGWPLATELGVRWASRYMSLWPLPAMYHTELEGDTPRIVRARSPSERTGFERSFNEEVLEDLQRFQPEIIVIPLTDSTIPASIIAQRFDYEAYFSADERFRSFFADYREVGRSGPYAIRVRLSR